MENDDIYTVDNDWIDRSRFCPKTCDLPARNHGVKKSEYKEAKELEDRKVRASRLPLYIERASKRIDLFKAGPVVQR